MSDRVTQVVLGIFAGIDRRDDLGTLYCGMADNRIGVARLILPEHLPSGAPAGGDGPKVGGQG